MGASARYLGRLAGTNGASHEASSLDRTRQHCALYFYKFGDLRRTSSIETIGERRGMGAGSLRMRVGNFKAIGSGGHLDHIRYLEEVETEVRTSVISRTGQRSVEVVEAILGKGSFKNPKDHEILAELFNLVTWRDKNAIILDPYAGSGTTGHSVLAMNAEDNGNRRFILIESGDPTEKKIPKHRYTDEITAERVRRVVTGQWADGKSHPKHKTGFHFYRARDEITKAAIMASTRESLADIILQVVEEESNRIDCRVDGHTYLIGRTRLGYGIALVWDLVTGKTSAPILTWKVLERVLDEADRAGVAKPVHIYATANTAPITDDLYRFHQIPNSILASLGILNGGGDGEE